MGRNVERSGSGSPLNDSLLPKLPSGRVISQKPAAYQDGEITGVLQHFATDLSGKALRMRRHLFCRLSPNSDIPTPTEAIIQWDFTPEKGKRDQEDDRAFKFVEYTITSAKTKIAVSHPFQQGQAEVAGFHVQENRPLRAFLYPQPKQYGSIPEFKSDEEAIQFLRQQLLDTLDNPNHTPETLEAYGNSQLMFLGDLKPDAENEASMLIERTRLVARALPDNEDQQAEARKLLEGLHVVQYVYSLHVAVGLTGEPSLQFLVKNISNVLRSYQEKLPKNILRCDFNPDGISVVRVSTGRGHFFYEDDPDLDRIPAQDVDYSKENVVLVSENDPNGYGYIFTKEDGRVHITLVKGQHRVSQYSIISAGGDQKELTGIGLEINSDYAQISESVAPVRFESPQGNLNTAFDAAA